MFLVSCEANIDLLNVSPEVSIDPSLIVPLGGASVSLGDLLSTYDTQHLFETNINEFRLQSFDSVDFKLPIINLVDNLSTFTNSFYISPDNIIIFPANSDFPAISELHTIDLGLNSNTAVERIDSVKIAAATIGVKISVNNLNISPSDLKITFTFSDRKMRMLDGSSSIFTFTPTAYNVTQNINISNFLLNTSNGATGLPLLIKIEAKTGNLPVTIDPSSRIDIQYQFNQLDWAMLYGKFDLSKIATSSQQIAIDLDTKLPTGQFYLANPQIDLTALTNIGVMLGFRLDYLKSYTTNDSVFAQFEGSKTFTKFFNSKPKFQGDTASLKLKTFDKTWGGTDKLLANKPKYLEYKFTALSDTINDLTQNFITPDAYLKVFFKTTIPLQFNQGSYYQYNDTINNVFQAVAKTLDQFTNASIQSASLVLNITNGLPVKTGLSFILIDSLNNEINISTDFKKLYEINSGEVDLNGIVQPGKETKQQLVITITKDQLTEIRKAKRIAYQVRVSGADIHSTIYFTKSNNFNLKVGLFIKGNLNNKSN